MRRPCKGSITSYIILESCSLKVIKGKLVIPFLLVSYLYKHLKHLGLFKYVDFFVVNIFLRHCFSFLVQMD